MAKDKCKHCQKKENTPFQGNAFIAQTDSSIVVPSNGDLPFSVGMRDRETASCVAPDDVNGKFVIQKAGTYSISFQGFVNSSEEWIILNFSAPVNGEIKNFCQSVISNGYCHVSTMLPLKRGDRISVKFDREVTVNYSRFQLFLIA